MLHRSFRRRCLRAGNRLRMLIICAEKINWSSIVSRRGRCGMSISKPHFGRVLSPAGDDAICCLILPSRIVLSKRRCLTINAVCCPISKPHRPFHETMLDYHKYLNLAKEKPHRPFQETMLDYYVDLEAAFWSSIVSRRGRCDMLSNLTKPHRPFQETMLDSGQSFEYDCK